MAKSKGFFCLPLGAVTLTFCVVMTMLQASEAVLRTKVLYKDAKEPENLQWLSDVMTLLPSLCVLLALIGTLLSNAKLLKCGSYAAYATCLPILAGLVTTWMELHERGEEVADASTGAKRGVSRDDYLVAGASSACSTIGLLLLCYMTTIFNSAAQRVRTGLSIWNTR